VNKPGSTPREAVGVVSIRSPARRLGLFDESERLVARVGSVVFGALACQLSRRSEVECRVQTASTSFFQSVAQLRLFEVEQPWDPCFV